VPGLCSSRGLRGSRFSDSTGTQKKGEDRSFQPKRAVGHAAPEGAAILAMSTTAASPRASASAVKCGGPHYSPRQMSDHRNRRLVLRVEFLQTVNDLRRSSKNANADRRPRRSESFTRAILPETPRRNGTRVQIGRDPPIFRRESRLSHCEGRENGALHQIRFHKRPEVKTDTSRRQQVKNRDRQWDSFRYLHETSNNKDGHFQNKSHDTSSLALADSFVRFRLFAPFFEPLPAQ
jgi:hypothetical protein